MKRILSAIFCVTLLTATVTLPVACKNVTKEAAAYYTLKDSWTLAKGSYDGWCERVVLGKVTKEQELQVDKAWNKFRASYSLAIKVAKFNPQGPADVELLNLQIELTDLIRKLSK